MGLPFENADYNEDEVGARKIQELTDVVLTDVANNEILVYNSSSEVWENQAQSGGSSITELNDIPGVTITNVQDNQFLKYDSGEWINSNITDNDTDNLNDLTDTLLTTPFGNDEVLKYNLSSGKWENGNIPIEKLSNVYISNLQDGETLRYVQQNTRWENAYNIDTLNELTDVNISTNQNNQVLKYNNSTGVYENQFLNLTDLGDTNITALVNGYTLIYNNGVWSAGAETDPVFTTSPVGSIQHGTGFLKNNGGTWSYDTNTYLTSANIYQLGGLTWNNLEDNEVIRRVDATNAEGAGMKLTDAVIVAFPQNQYYKTISYFNKVSPVNIQFGANRFESNFVGYNQRIIPYSSILSSTTPVSGLYLHHAPSINDYNVRVGVNNKYPSQDFQVGTTLYVDDTDKKVGIGIADPDENLEVDGSIQIDSNGAARLKFKKSGVSPHALGEIDAEEDPIGGDGGRLKFYTKTDGVSGNGTEKLRINNEGKLGFRGASYGTAGQVLTNNSSGLPEWMSPTAPPPGAFGVFYLDGALTIPQNTAQQVNNLIPHPSFTPLTGMSILSIRTGNTPQPITITDAGTYLFSYSINAQGLSGSTINTFQVLQNGSMIHYNWYVFSGIENKTSSWMVKQTTADVEYTFIASASGNGHYRLNGFGAAWTQISITKLF